MVPERMLLCESVTYPSFLVVAWMEEMAGSSAGVICAIAGSTSVIFANLIQCRGFYQFVIKLIIIK